jgi:hypothetical protein
VLPALATAFALLAQSPVSSIGFRVENADACVLSYTEVGRIADFQLLLISGTANEHDRPRGGRRVEERKEVATTVGAGSLGRDAAGPTQVEADARRTLCRHDPSRIALARSGYHNHPRRQTRQHSHLPACAMR